jgi:surface antigen
MKKTTRAKRIIATLVSASLIGTTMLPTGLAYADGRHKHKGYKHGHYDRGNHYGHYKHHKHYKHYRHGKPYRYSYGGHRHHSNNDIWVFLGLAALTVAVVSSLNREQRVIHEQAQARATTAPIGETIIWQDGNASGSVTATREGRTPSGRYCREFQHEVIVGGQREEAYGTACQQPDGSWQILSENTP